MKKLYFPWGKAFKKQTKTIEEQGKKQIDAITNQNKRLNALTNKEDHKSIYKEIFDKLVKEKFDAMQEWYEHFRKIQFSEMKLEDVKELQNIFKPNLNKILKSRYKSEEQKSALQNIMFITNLQKLLLNYLMTILQLYLRLNTNQFMEKVSKY